MDRGRAAIIAAAGALAAGVAARTAVDRTRKAAVDVAPPALRGVAAPVTTVDGVRLYVEVDELDAFGAEAADPRQATVVFVHGFTMSQDCWHYQRAYFRGRRRLVLLDHRSHGRSSASIPERLTLQQLGLDLLEVLDARVPDGPVVLVGHSMGGMTIMSLAEQHPELFGDRVIGVVLIGTAAGGMATHSVLAPIVPDQLAERVKPPITRALRAVAPALDATRGRFPNVMFAGARLVGMGKDANPEHIAVIARDLNRVPAMVVIDMASTFDDHNRYDALDAIGEVPTLIVTGSRDLVVPTRHSRDLHERIPGSTLLALDGPGHCVMIERGEQVNAAIEQLIVGAENAAI